MAKKIFGNKPESIRKVGRPNLDGWKMQRMIYESRSDETEAEGKCVMEKNRHVS
jgi:hypothetical protein